ncbi:MAG: hypothetical protein PHF79_01115 [Candidatus Pacebacteria bacterium]|nr:hypothetical protein [Candidatus Paceibacterota bacterium]
MKKIVNILTLLSFTILIAASFFFSNNKANALSLGDLAYTVPFGGHFTSLQVCCNGFLLQIQVVQGSPGGGSYLLAWQDLFTALKMNYMPLPNNNTLGQADRIGQCYTIYSECESTMNVDYNFSGPNDSLGTSSSS